MQKASFRDYLQTPQAQLILVNSLTCGLEVCLAAGISFVPPLLLEAGVEEKFMTMVLGIGPIFGLLVVHLIGSASDRWNSRYGRRRPFIWLLCFGGVRMGSLGLFLQSVISIAFSASMDHLVRTFGTRFVYIAGVSCLPVAATIMCFSSNVVMVTASAAITGIPFSVLQILPYTLTSLYHHNRQVFLPKYKDVVEDETVEKERKSAFIKEATDSNGDPLFSSNSPSLCLGPSCDGSFTVGESTAPNHGICLDIAILDSACLLSQVVPSLLMGFIVQKTQTVTAYVASAAAFGLVAVYFSNKVVFEKSDMMKMTPL